MQAQTILCSTLVTVWMSSLFMKSIKPNFLWFAVHASKIYQDFYIFLSWQPRSYVGDQREGFFGVLILGIFFKGTDESEQSNMLLTHRRGKA